jgi:hypothetical protein
MKYCHFIIEISLIALLLLTGCLDPTNFDTNWKPPPPPILKPELKNMTGGNKVLTDGEQVHVYIGSSISISINNFLLANYSTIEWKINNNITPITDYVFVVNTDSSPFNNEDTYELAVTGAHIGGSQTTKIKIKVEKPLVAKPALRLMTSSTILQEGAQVDVFMGSTVTIILNNFSNYSTIEWSSGGTYLSNDTAYVVSTNTLSFSQEGLHPLTVKGTNNLGDSNTTTISINVVKPDFPVPELKDMNTNSIVNEGGTAQVIIGSTLTISINNWEAAAYHNIKWYINDEFNIATEDAIVFTVHTDVSPFDEKGTYNLKVEGIKNGDTKTKTIKIVVKNPPEHKWVPTEHADEIIDAFDAPDTIGITNWTNNAGNTSGKAAWYKTYTGAGAEGRFLADFELVKEFMRSTNDTNLWPSEERELTEAAQFQIYIYYNDYIAQIRINDGTNWRTFYEIRLGDYEVVYDDD